MPHHGVADPSTRTSADVGAAARAVTAAGGRIVMDRTVIAGVGAFLGHLFPVWLRFKGGKGVATYIGILIGLYWPAALAFAAIWIVVALAFRYSSLSALVASLVMPLLLWAVFNRVQIAEVSALLTVLLWIMHRENIARLLSGREGKIGQKG